MINLINVDRFKFQMWWCDAIDPPIIPSLMSFELDARPVAILVALTLASLYVFRVIRWNGTHPLPPGPKGIPLFGNFFQLSTMPWKEFEVWKERYGTSIMKL